MAGALTGMLLAPVRKYNQLLERSPIATKCVTSGFMYALGDIAAQGAQHYNAEKDAKKHDEDAAAEGQVVPHRERKRFRVDWERAGLFFVFGTVVGGPLYHFWFGWLDTLPAKLFAMRQTRQRFEILRAYNLLKRHGIEVNLRVEKLPSAQPLGKWTQKAWKIAADQLIFSSTYTLIFFLVIGMMKGGVAKYKAHKKLDDLQEWEDELHAKFGLPAHAQEAGSGAAAGAGASGAVGASASSVTAAAAAAGAASPVGTTALMSAGAGSVPPSRSGSNGAGSSPRGILSQPTADLVARIAASEHKRMERQLLAMRHSALSKEGAEEAVESIDRVLHLLMEEQAKKQLTWGDVWAKTWADTKEVYLTTYLVDCVVWPPLQLINFTFIPLRLQVLYVNVANLFWNTFLSLMANKSH